MRVDVVVPRTSDTVEEATLVRWTKRPGDAVDEGEVIAELETDKAAVDLEAPASGVVAELLAAEGREGLRVGEVIARIESGAVGEAVRHGPAPAEIDGEERAPAATAEPRPANAARDRTERAAAVPSAASRSSEPRGGMGGPAELPARVARGEGRSDTAPAATPLASAMAAIAGIATPRPSGGDVVTRRDVERLLDLAPRPEPAADAGTLAGRDARGGELVPHTPLRKATAARMAESKQRIPHFYLSTECDVGAALDLLARLESERTGARLTLTVLAVRAAASALREVPLLNGVWSPGAVELRREVNVAVGVATPAGLAAPVVRAADRKSLGEIAAELGERIGRAKAGKLRPDDLADASFTISNLGMYGVDSLFAIVTPGQSAVLGLGAATRRPVVRPSESRRAAGSGPAPDLAIEIATLATATLSADHRALDGAHGAEFLRAFRERFEDPARMLV